MPKRRKFSRNKKGKVSDKEFKADAKTGKERNNSNFKTKSYNQPKINTSKTNATDIFAIFSANDNELKLSAEALGSLSGEIKLTPQNYTVIHDIDNYPIIGKNVDIKSVLSAGKGNTGSFLARFKDQLQFQPHLNVHEMLNLAQTASHDIARVASLAPILSHKVLKINPNGTRPLYFPQVKPEQLGNRRANNAAGRTRLLGNTLYATEKHLTKKIEEFFLPLQDNEGTEFDIYTLFVRFNRINQTNNNNESQNPVKEGVNISNDAINALGYMKNFYDKYIGAIDNIFTRLNILTKASESIRHISKVHNRSVNDFYGSALNSSTFRGAVSSLMDDRMLLRASKTYHPKHAKSLNVVAKPTTGKTTAMDIVTTTYFSFINNQAGNNVNDPHIAWDIDTRNFNTIPKYTWHSTNNAWEVSEERDFVADIVTATAGNVAEPTVFISVADQQRWVNGILAVYTLLEPTNIPWDLMTAEDWRYWRNAVIDALATVSTHIIHFNQAMMPFLQVLSRCETYGLSTGYTKGTDENYSLIMSTAIADFSGSTTTKILNDLVKVTALQDPSDGTTIEAEYNATLFNSLISEDTIQYFTGEVGLYNLFYYISRPTGLVTGTAGVGYTLVNNVANDDLHSTDFAARTSRLALVTWNGNSKVEQDWNANFTAVNLLVNYSSRLNVRTTNGRINTILDSTCLASVDYHVNSLYNEIVKIIDQAGLNK